MIFSLTMAVLLRTGVTSFGPLGDSTAAEEGNGYVT